MANEITAQATLTFQRDAIALQASGSRTCDQTGTKGLLNQVSVTTSITKLYDATSPAPLASLGCIFVKNISTGSDNLKVSFDSGVSGTAILSTLKPGEFCLLAANLTPSVHLYAQAVSGTIPVLIGITEC